jgi:hypothetical protein
MFNVSVGDEGYVDKSAEEARFFQTFNSPGFRREFTKECSLQSKVKVRVEEVASYEDNLRFTYTEYLVIESIRTYVRWVVLSENFLHER